MQGAPVELQGNGARAAGSRGRWRGLFRGTRGMCGGAWGDFGWERPAYMPSHATIKILAPREPPGTPVEPTRGS